MSDLLFEQESYAINGAAMDVYNNLGRGFLEAVYQEALGIELTTRGIPFEPQKELFISYKGKLLEKKYIADFLVYGKIIVEIKAQKNLTDVDKAQTINYLKATGCELALLYNFGSADKLEVLRLARTISKT